MTPADEDLVARAIADADVKAYGELVRRHQSHVRNWLRQLTRDPAAADDIAQETFIRAWHKLHTFVGKGRFIAWLMKLAHNEFLQNLRRAQRTQRLADAVAAESQDAGMFVSDFEDEIPDVPRFLDELSEAEQKVMLLVYAYGLSHGEASSVTGLPLGTVKSHVRRSKEKIRSRFDIDKTSHD